MDNVVIINNGMIIPMVQAILSMSALTLHTARNTIIHVHHQEATTLHVLKYASSVTFPMLSRLSSVMLHLILPYFTK